MKDSELHCTQDKNEWQNIQGGPKTKHLLEYQ